MSGESNASYSAVYKCRLCGEKYTSGNCLTGSRAKAAGIVIALAVDSIDYHDEPLAPTMQWIHYCDNGDVGTSDFQGWAIRKE